MFARGPLFSFSHKYPEVLRDQKDFLQKFSTYFSKIILSKRQKEAVSKGRNPPLETVQKAILMSTKTVLELQEKILQDPEVEFFSAGRTSGDPIESHNGHVRIYQKFPLLSRLRSSIKSFHSLNF